MYYDKSQNKVIVESVKDVHELFWSCGCDYKPGGKYCPSIWVGIWERSEEFGSVGIGYEGDVQLLRKHMETLRVSYNLSNPETIKGFCGELYSNGKFTPFDQTKVELTTEFKIQPISPDKFDYSNKYYIFIDKLSKRYPTIKDLLDNLTFEYDIADGDDFFKITDKNTSKSVRIYRSYDYYLFNILEKLTTLLWQIQEANERNREFQDFLEE